MNFRLIFAIISLLLIAIKAEYAPIVETKHGKIRGIINTVGIWTKAHLYQGIRFAIAERFAKPKRVEKFDEEIYDAIKERYTCPQFLTGSGSMEKYFQFEKNEECLYLNIYKPESKSEKLLPVMVWFYGGGFQGGSIFMPIYDGTYLASNGNVIVVSINYRLGPFGFLYSGTDDAPGNQAFYDQIMGLEWIRDNIEHFGGDRNQVTIFGESAGSFSVSALILSPLAKGLFHRAILQSGTLVPSFRTVGKKGAIEKTMKLAKDLNCNQNEMSKIIECLRTKSTQEIVDAAKNDLALMITNKMFSPILGDDVLPEDVTRFKYGSNGPIDFMFGVTRDEGSRFVKEFFPELSDDYYQITEKRTKEMIRELLSYYKINDDDKEIENYYLNRIDMSDYNQIRKMINDIFGDLRFNCPSYLFIQKMIEANPNKNFYAYRFDRRSFVSNLMDCQEWMGVCHASELLYVFSNSMMSIYPSDSQLSTDMMNSWTNFAKNGNPSPMGTLEWPKYNDKNNDSMQWMIIDVEKRIETNLYKDVCENIWSKQYDIIKYGDDKAKEIDNEIDIDDKKDEL